MAAKAAAVVLSTSISNLHPFSGRNLYSQQGELMKKTNILFLIMAVALVGFTSPASASSTKYTVLKGGVYSPSSSYRLDSFNEGETRRLDSKTGFAGEIAVGHYLLPMLAIELGIGYFESKGSPAAQPGEAKLTVVPVTVSGKVFFPIGPVEPYGLAGIGAYFSDLKVSGSEENFRSSTEITYGLHLGGGLNFNFHETMFAGVEGKYLWAEPSFGGQHIALDGFIATANIGFRY
jgi:opacity protein-like surface antigen